VTWPLAVAGTVHRDDITTPHGRVSALGGSAVYFALAASRFAPVLLHGIVGSDCAQRFTELLTGFDIDCSGLVVSDTPTFVWHAEHDFDRWITSAESAEEGCDPEWSAQLSPAGRAAPVLFVASMRPALQAAVLAQTQARVIGADTMTVYTAGQRDQVRSVAAQATLLLLNHAELAGLTGDDDELRAARALLNHRTRAVIVKRGPRGVALVTAAGVRERAAHPVAQVVDPTGAGDALAGGFLATFCAAERDDEGIYDAALSAGLECAAHAISSFGTDALRRFVRS
jgi:cytidine kinase